VSLVPTRNRGRKILQHKQKGRKKKSYTLSREKQKGEGRLRHSNDQSPLLAIKKKKSKKNILVLRWKKVREDE